MSRAARPSLLASRSLFTHSRNRYLDPRWDRYPERAMAYGLVGTIGVLSATCLV